MTSLLVTLVQEYILLNFFCIHETTRSLNFVNRESSLRYAKIGGEMRMKKYWLVFKTAAQDQIAERVNVLFWIVLLLLPLASFIFLWITVYSQNQSIGGFHLNELITYYFGVSILNWISIWAHWGIDYNIREGRLNTYLVRPLNYFSYKFAKMVGKDITHSVLGLPIFAAVGFVIKDYLTLPISTTWFLLIIMAVVLSILLQYIFSFCLGTVTFWTLEGTGFFYFIHTVVNFSGGTTLPLSAFPATIKSVLGFLPFRFFYSFPMELYLGKLDTVQVLHGFIIQGFWITAFYLLYRLLWSRGLKRYSAFGG